MMIERMTKDEIMCELLEMSMEDEISDIFYRKLENNYKNIDEKEFKKIVNEWLIENNEAVC